MSIDDGGPAFPLGADLVDEGSSGMSIRDYYISQLLKSHDWVDDWGARPASLPPATFEEWVDQIVVPRLKYLADAMIAERNKQPEQEKPSATPDA